MANEYEIKCPMPDCSEALLLQWTQAYALSPDDLKPLGEGEELPGPMGAHSCAWSVECLAGHVVLLPSENLGCPCEADAGGEGCPHFDDDYDWAEEVRVYRESDVTRLRALIERLS